MRLRTLIGLGAIALALATTAPAMAQQTTTVYQTPPPPPTTVYRTAPPGTTVYTTTTPTTTSPVVVETEARPRRHMIRFRFGIDGTGGAFVRGPQLAFGGLRARLGIQLGDWFSLYYQPTGLVGAFMHRADGRDAAAGLLWNSFLAEVTLFDIVQLGAGPSVDFVWGCSDTPNSSLSCSDHGPFFGIDGRVAVVIGHDMMGSRGGLTLSADVHPTWYADDTVGLAVLGGIGIDMY
jgi:hypothetical protein